MMMTTMMMMDTLPQGKQPLKDAFQGSEQGTLNWEVKAVSTGSH